MFTSVSVVSLCVQPDLHGPLICLVEPYRESAMSVSFLFPVAMLLTWPSCDPWS